MQIAFLMDRLESINPLMETTSHLMYECNQRGHTVFFLEPHDVYIRKNEVVARMRNITVPPDLSMKRYWRSLINCLKKDELIFESISDLDALFLRKNPPLIYQTMEFLTPMSDRVFMINSTSGQLLANSKLYTLNFPEIIPETHISRDPLRLQKNLNSLINYYVQAFRSYPDREPIMVQEYLDGVQKRGDVRILLLNGEILGAMRRKPQDGDFRTNIHAGARAYAHEITREERNICRTIKERLVEDGLFFVGIDIIGDKLVEINCVSPGGIPRINRLEQAKLEAKVIDFIERKVKEMQSQHKKGR
jgi:glutathione synthase